MYVSALHPTIERSDLQTDGCQVMHERIRNGLWIEESHCPSCAERVRTCKPIEWRVRDTNGRVITCDWIM